MRKLVSLKVEKVIPLPRFAIHISKLMAESQKTLVFSKGEFLCE